MALSIAKAISSTSTSLLVNGTIQNLSGPGILTIESEQLSYTGNSENEFFGLVRGYNSTTAVAHALGVAVSATSNEPSGIGDINGTLPIAVSGGTGVLLGSSATISIPAATDSVSGYLTSTDHSKITISVPNTRTVNGHALSGNIVVTNADLGAVPTSTTVNGHALSSNVVVTASDVGLGNVTNVAQKVLPSVFSTGTSQAMVADGFYVCTASITLTLPTAVGVTGHQVYVNTGGNTVSVNTSMSQTVNGISSFSVPISATFISDGANWWTTAS
jgi:hypothetical protein